MSTSGQLKITIVEADLTRDTEWFGKMDPCCVMKFKGQRHKTATHYEGGKKPRWNKMFVLHVQDITDKISFKIEDVETINNDDVGDTTMTVSQIIGQDMKGKSDKY